MRPSPRAVALVLTVSLLPALMMMAHWAGSTASNVRMSDASTSTATVRHDSQPKGMCEDQSPCADAQVHAIAVATFISTPQILPLPALSATTQGTGWVAALGPQNSVVPSLVPPRSFLS